MSSRNQKENESQYSHSSAHLLVSLFILDLLFISIITLCDIIMLTPVYGITLVEVSQLKTKFK